MAYLTAILSFAYVLRGDVLGIPFTTLELSIVAMIVVYLGEKAWLHESLPDPRREQYFWPVTLLLVAAALGVAFAADHRAAAATWKAYFLEPALTAYVVADCLRTRFDLERFIGGLFISGIIVSVFNILVFMFAVGVHRPHLVDLPPVVIYSTHNAIGLFIGPLLAIALVLLLDGTPSERFRAAFFVVFAAPAFILSFSRGAWLGLVAALVFVSLTQRRQLQFAIALVLAGVVALVVPPFRRRILVEFDPNDPFNTVNSREHIWSASVRMLTSGRHIVTGAGLSGFKHEIARFKAVGGYGVDQMYPHNIFLNFWSETGLLGLVAFIWLAVSWSRETASALRRRSALHAYYLGLAAASITILVHGLFDVPFFKDDLAFLTVALLGVQVAALRQEDGEAPALAA